MEMLNDDDDDIKITKVIPVKKAMSSWVASSFDGFGLEPQPTPRKSQSTPFSRCVGGKQTTNVGKQNPAASRKRSRDGPVRLSSKPSLSSQNHELWSDRYSPNSRAELAVHKKKVEEIADWLGKAASQHGKRGSSPPILLLTGPPGAGKTACVRVLCKELGWEIQEWSGTSEQAADQWVATEDRTERSAVDAYQSQSQSSTFYNFLLRANKYKSLDITGVQGSSSVQNSASCHGRKTVIVMEELPNIFYRNAVQFHDILRKYKGGGKSPLVFIMSDSNNNSSNIQKLFPKDLLYQLQISNICMNPVAPTMLVKLLTRVASLEAAKSHFGTPSTSVIETVAMSSSGDIRSALNTLQFACGKDTRDLNTFCPVKPKPEKANSGSGRARLKYSSSRGKSGEGVSGEDAASALGIKDKAVFLFQSVGKILHFKRGDPKDHPVVPSLPKHLSQHERDPLLIDPEDVAFKSQLSGDFMTSFLHENYVEFLSTVEDLERAAEYFSDSDYLSALWMAREELQTYSVSVATRGFIHSNSEISRHDSPRRSHGWLPLHKSRWFSTAKQANENIVSARQLFKGYHWKPETLCTEILPYISLTNPTLHDPGQIRFVQEMTLFSKSSHNSRAHLERLNEKDIVECGDEEGEGTVTKGDNKTIDEAQTEDCDDCNMASSQNQIQPGHLDGDNDDFVIEEYDDDDDFGDFVF